MQKTDSNSFRRILWFTVPATLFAAYTTFYAWRHGGEILVFLGLTIVFAATVVAGFGRGEHSPWYALTKLMLLIGLGLFFVGAFWHPTQL